MQRSREDHEVALRQTLALIPLIQSNRYEMAEVMSATTSHRPGIEVFEKDGFVWIDRIGLKFSEDGTIDQVVPAWE